MNIETYSMDPSCSCGKFPARLAEIPPRVLVIDDEPLVRWSLKAGLKAAGFEAIGAVDAAEALMLARQTAPDVILLDMSLWNTDPVRLLRELRSVAPACRVVCLAVSGQEVSCAGLDGCEVVRKPFDLHEVVRVVEATLCPTHRVPHLAG
jgi:DNA-binding response OmpR family regulator